MPPKVKHLTRRQRQDQQAAHAATSKKGSRTPRDMAAECGSSDVNNDNPATSSGSHTSKDAHHMSLIRIALAVVADVGPLVHMQRALPPGSSFTMEKSVFDVPMADVKRALAYYDELEVRGGLTPGQEEIVKAGKKARGELKRLIDMRDGRRGITVVDV